MYHVRNSSLQEDVRVLPRCFHQRPDPSGARSSGSDPPDRKCIEELLGRELEERDQFMSDWMVSFLGAVKMHNVSHSGSCGVHTIIFPMHLSESKLPTNNSDG